jgi:4-hydroxy-2-oxoheptanedioate aldolase
MLGPGDFGILSGVPGQFFHPKVQAAKEKIAAAAKKAGIHWGCPCLNLEDMKKNMELGAKFICYSADITLLRRGLEQVQADCTPMGITFNNQLATL